MQCGNCGAEVAEGKKFCSNCGTPVAASARHCTNCGAEMGAAENFCTECGTQQAAGGPPSPTVATASPPPGPSVATASLPPGPSVATASAPPPGPSVATASPPPDPRAETAFLPPPLPRPTAAAPQKVEKPRAEASAVEFKGIVPRLIATMIDAFLFLAPWFVLNWEKPIAQGQGFFNKFIPADWAWWLPILLVVLPYYVLLEGFLGGTIGKLILGMRVVNGQGRAPGPAPALIRNVLRIVDFLPLFYLLGLLLIATSREKQRLGDRVAGTFVVSRRGAATLRNSGGILKGAGGTVAIVAALVLVLVAAGGGYLYLFTSGNPAAGLASMLAGQGATGGSLSGTELGGLWEGAMTMGEGSMQGGTAQEQQTFQNEYKATKGQSIPMRLTVAPSGNDSGSLIMELGGGTMPPSNYRYQGGSITFEVPLPLGSYTFEGKPARKGSGYGVDGTFKASGKSAIGTVTIQGTWTTMKK